MGWVRLSDDFYDHPKFAYAGPLGIALWAAGLAWCNRNLTDGFIPRARARTLLDFDGLALVSGMQGQDATADIVISILVDAGLWDLEDGGYRFHDYHDYQPRAEDVQAKRLDVSSKRSEAGRKGGLVTQSHNRRPDEANEQTANQMLEQTSSNGSSTCFSNSQAPTPIPNPKSSKQALTSPGAVDNPAAAVDNFVEKRNELTYRAIWLLAERAAQRVNPANPNAYLAATRRGLEEELAERLAGVDWAQNWTPESLADWLKPQVPAHKTEPANLGRAYDRVPVACDVCEGSGMYDYGNGYENCRACRSQTVP